MAKDIDAPADLVQLQRITFEAEAEAVRRGLAPEEWRPWVEASAVVQNAISEHASEARVNRLDLERVIQETAREN